MVKTLKEINKIINGELCGNGEIEICGVAGIKEARDGEITFVAHPRYRREMDKTGASAIIIGRDVVWNGKPVIRVENPYFAFAKVLELFARPKRQPMPGINQFAIIGQNVNLGERVSIQAFTVIGDNVQIGDDTVIGPLVYIGDDTKIGFGVLIYPRVTIREEVTIGNDVIIHSGAVIGSDGFGFAKVSDRHHKIPQIGTVIIEDSVEIGANTTVDRATITDGATIIKRGSKIDNLVQIAHNVVIGEDCRITAQTAIAGSTEVKDRVTFAGQSGVSGHLTIGEDSVILARAGVTKDLPPNSYVSGFPAIPHSKDLRLQASMHKLPDVLNHISELEKKVAELEEKLKEKCLRG
ncbi:TPA: UDP-3-O-(3-hydroxymyristoyl)glucosamine N-acyltransferase [Candidatus Poribacteria bacterium]|nr:UDP-3-O-(3-hydroxymyristoyl)glucosamine N-acyltransferase [Candidatus Poribacteria bacterium]